MEFLAYCQDLVYQMHRLRWDQTGNHRRPFGALNLRPPQSGKKREKLKHFPIGLGNEYILYSILPKHKFSAPNGQRWFPV